MKLKRFYKTQLATSVSLILGASFMAPLSAQEVAADDVEVINVTGIRGSMIKSMDIKRSSDGIVDAINAEDIGKFPDSNLAESLQRITGVSIDRNNGEGSQVSVRGFSGARNLVTLNGRQLPTTTGARSFDFANLAAEGVSGVEVYKTSNASVPTGGIGATINILTNKPLNNPGMHSTVSAQVMDDSSTQTGGMTPELSGIYSNTSDDGKFGVSISGSYSERESGNQQANVGTGWRSFTGITDQDWSGPNAAWGGVPKNEFQQNRPGDSDIYSVPQTTIYKFEETQRTRSNAQLVLQYSPMDNLTATLDYTYVKRDIDTQFNDVSAWYGFSPSKNVWTDGPISSPLLYSEDYVENGVGLQDVAMGGGDYGTSDETKSLGFNIEYEVNENLKLELDYHNSSAKNVPNNEFGSNNTLAMAGFVRQAAATDFSGDLPILAIRGGNAIQASDMVVTGSVFTNNQNHADMEQAQFRGEYILEDAGSIDFGISLTTAENRGQTHNVQRNNWGGEGTPGMYDASLFPRETIHDKFTDVSGGNFEDFNGLYGENYEIMDTYFAFDFHGIRDAAAQQLSVQAGALGDCGNSFCPSTDYSAQTDRYNKEEMTAVYLQYNYDGEIGDMPYDVHVGLRYEETDVTSTSAVAGYENGARWVGTTEVFLAASGEREFQSQKGSYDHTLPSINFNIEVTDDVKLRAAYSQTIGRPGYGDMIGGTSLNQGGRVDGGVGATGSAALLPLESDNLDLSAEWYYAEGSYVSLGYFQKDVTNDISSIQVATTSPGIYNPADGAYQREALAAVGNDGNLQKQYIFDTYAATDPEHVFMEAGAIVIVANPATDNLMSFDIQTPSNSTEKKGFDGLEFAVQHIFGDTGFGGIANYTQVNTDNEYDNFNLGDQVAEFGISDTANLVAFYEKDGWSVRVAYNWRDKFLVSGFQGDVGPSPRYVEAYGQYDLTVSYAVPQLEGLTLFLNGINITDEYIRQSGRDEYQVLNVTQQGARYNLGARYTF
jgi:TonB-dependent receptor